MFSSVHATRKGGYKVREVRFVPVSSRASQTNFARMVGVFNSSADIAQVSPMQLHDLSFDVLQLLRNIELLNKLKSELIKKDEKLNDIARLIVIYTELLKRPAANFELKKLQAFNAESLLKIFASKDLVKDTRVTSSFHQEQLFDIMSQLHTKALEIETSVVKLINTEEAKYGNVPSAFEGPMEALRRVRVKKQGCYKRSYWILCY